jgi:cephalosporin hydroxylase
MGRPIIQYPQDIVAVQELIWDVKPDLIIETGVAHGGSAVFFASLLELNALSGGL